MHRFILCLVLYGLLIATVEGEDVWPGSEWAQVPPADVGMDESKLKQARDYALTGGGSGYITRHGKLVMSWGDVRRRYDLKSTTKSIGVTAIGLAISDQKIALTDLATKHHSTFGTPPDSNRNTGWVNRITIQHLATQTAGFEKQGGYTKLIFEPGTKWSYSDGGPNWLAECVTLACQRDIDELMFDRVFTPIGVTRKDLSWRRNSYRPKQINGVARREFGSGISANVDAMARVGYLYLREGKWRDKQLVPGAFVRSARSTVKSVVGIPEVDAKRYGNASDHYGLLWWNNADGTLKNVPRDAYWSWGLYESLIVVIPSLDIVVARAGKSWKRNWSGHYDVLQPFFDPIVASVQANATSATGTSKPSTQHSRNPVIESIQWADKSTIVRKAKGSDNWPITWGDDDALYTAYGDGRGFQPFVERKLSMGLCRVVGTPDAFTGSNLRSKTAERTGGGASGPKASGLLMVDGVLYMLLRNTGNSQLAWSTDRGQTWTWSKWKFSTSFGYPTFLNFGKNYANARDGYVYVYSHDSDSAYKRADRMVLARVAKDRIREQDAYEFFEQMKSGSPVWTDDIERRGTVLSKPGGCYRSSVSFNVGLGRYLWCQTGEGKDTRFRGGFSIYDAPEPCGPWTVAFSVDEWDVGPGETSCLPTK